MRRGNPHANAFQGARSFKLNALANFAGHGERRHCGLDARKTPSLCLFRRHPRRPL